MDVRGGITWGYDTVVGERKWLAGTGLNGERAVRWMGSGC